MHYSIGTEPPAKWHDSGEFSSDTAMYWIDKVHGSPRYNVIPAPNHWPSELEHVISWTDNVTRGFFVCVVMGKVRHNENIRHRWQ